MGLILPRNSLAYPGGQARPGFNPAHLAAKGIRYSGVAQTGTMVSLQTAKRATINGAITAGLNGSIGPVVVNTSSTAFLSTPGINETPSVVTFGAIVVPTGSSPTFGFVFNNDSGVNTGLYLGGLTPKLLVSNTAVIVASFNLTANVPYFLAVSFNAVTVNFVGVNLATGQIYTTTGSNSTAIVATSGAQYDIGGTGSSSQSMVANLAAVMYSVNNFLSIPQLKAWAQVPWDFWYPPTARQTLFASLNGGPSGVTASVAETWTPTDAVIATPAFSASVTETWLPSDAIQAATSLPAIVAETWAPSDAVSTSLAMAASVAEIWRPMTATVADLQDHRPRPPPIWTAQVPYLREMTYRRRFLGVSFDPTLVITKERPGPLRIVELDFWNN